MAIHSTDSGLDWKIWFAGFGVIAVGLAYFQKDDVKTAAKVELGSDHVDQSMSQHAKKNREASDVLRSIAGKEQQ